jgi:hypothetical protein
VFTDYTGKEERKIEKEKRDKDPILFGSFQSKDSYIVIDRFYYLGDWEDDYCDLTLEKMVGQMSEATGKNIIRNISIPKTPDELRSQLNLLDDNGYMSASKTPPAIVKPQDVVPVEESLSDKDIEFETNSVVKKESLGDKVKKWLHLK